MKINKNPERLKMILIVIGIQFIVATVTLLMYGNGHPLIQYIRSIHVGFLVIIISIVGFIIYAVPGYLLVISKSNKRNLIETIDSAVLVLTGILLATFLIIFVYSYLLHLKTPWLFYSLINPIFGNLMYDTMQIRSFMNLVWLPSTIIPGLGILFGAFVRLKQEGVVKV